MSNILKCNYCLTEYNMKNDSTLTLEINTK